MGNRVVSACAALILSCAVAWAAEPSADVVSLAKQSVALEQQGATIEALELCQRARELSPRDSTLALLEGHLLAKLGATAQALQALQNARDLGSTEPEAWLVAAILLRDSQRIDEAIAVLDDAVAKGRKEPETFEQLSLLLLQKGDSVRARKVAEDGVAATPEDPGLMLALGLSLTKDVSSKARAIELLEKALTAGAPEPGKIHLEVGNTLLDVGQTDQAIQHLREASRLLPENPEASYRLATALRASGDAAGAATELSRFQELSKQRDAREWNLKKAGTRLNEAQELATQNRLDDALQAVDGLLKDSPDYGRAYTLRAKLLFSMGRREEALEAVLRARDLTPGAAENHYLHGLFLRALDRNTEAEAPLRRAVTLAPDQVEVQELLGIVLDDLGKTEEAVDHYRQAQALGSKSPSLAANLDAAARRLEAQKVATRP